MPNHLHCLLFPARADKSLNKLVSEGKRFMSYTIVKGLKKTGKVGLLRQLEEGVQDNERQKGKKHQVFRLSFDARACLDEKMVEQKLDYIHRNPVSVRSILLEDYVEYEHSGAAFYEIGFGK